MRKKLFAILMSAMMMVTFMPAMAFATPYAPYGDADHHYYYQVDAYGYVSVAWSDIKTAAATKTNGITLGTEPTETTDGTIEMKCLDTVGSGANAYACDAVITAKVKKLGEHKCSTYTLDATVLPTEYVSAMVAQKVWNEKKAAREALLYNTYCAVVTKKCAVCGAIDPSTHTPVAHEEGNDTKNCTKEHAYNCTKCGAALVAHKGTAHVEADTKAETRSKVSDATCGANEIWQGTCETCKQTVKYEKASTAKGGCVATTEIAVSKKTVTGGVEYYSEGAHIASNCNNTPIQTTGWYNIGKWKIKNGYYVDTTYDTPVFYKWDKVVTAAKTCGDTQTVAVTCKKCGSTMKSFTIASELKHDWETVEIAANCFDGVKYYKVCKNCGKYATMNADGTVTSAVESYASATKINVANKPALGHSYVVKKVEASCLNKAYYIVQCSVCGCGCSTDGAAAPTKETFAKTVEAGKFDQTNKTSLWLYTDGTYGSTHKAGEIELPFISNTDGTHKYTKKVVVKEATCVNNTVEGYKCDTCGKVCMSGTYAPSPVVGTKKDHELVEFTVAPACQTPGFTLQYCKNCGVEPLDLALQEGESIAVGNCVTVKGVDLDNHKTNVLNENIYKVTAVTKALGGKCTFDAWKTVKAATIFEEGIKAIACSKCGKFETAGNKTVIAKLSYAAPKVSVKKGKVIVTVAAQEGAVKYVVKAGKKTKTVTAAGKVTLKKVAKKGKKAKVTVTAYNAAGAKVVSKAKTVKAK